MTITPALLQTPSTTPKTKGIIDTITTWIWTGRYRRQLHGLVEQQSHKIIYARLAGSDFAQQTDSLTAGMFPDSSPEIQTLVSDQGRILKTNIQGVTESIAEELRDEIAIRNTKVQRLQSNLSDKQQTLHRSEENSIEPIPQDLQSMTHISELQKTLDYVYASFRRLRAVAALTVAQIITVLGLEGTLTHLSLFPLFAGVAGVTQWMIVTQALVITLALVYLGHNLWSQNRDTRWFSTVALIAMITALALVRAAGMMSYGANGVPQYNTHSTTTWALIAMMALVGFVLALIGGQAFHRLNKTFAEASRLRNATSQDIAEKEAELYAYKSHQARQVIYRLKQKRLIHSTQKDIQRITATLQREVAATRRIIARRVKRSVHTRLYGEISNMGRQLAEWRHNSPLISQ